MTILLIVLYLLIGIIVARFACYVDKLGIMGTREVTFIILMWFPFLIFVLTFTILDGLWESYFSKKKK